jgi:D-alanine-D-alanine ligase-like ATP-grasp enzyme
MKPLPSSLDQITNLHTKIYATEALTLGLTFEVIQSNLINIISPSHRSFVFCSRTQTNTHSSLAICRQKHVTHRLLAHHHLPVPKQVLINRSANLESQLQNLPFPAVLKPTNQHGGKDVFVNIDNFETLTDLINSHFSNTEEFLVEEYLSGKDFRVVVLDGQIIALVHRQPPFITGDGLHSIDYLSHSIPRLLRDHEYHSTLSHQGFTPHSIPPKNKQVFLRQNANISTGAFATAIPVESLHQDTVKLILKATSVLQLRLAALDVLMNNPESSPSNNLWFIEANGNPGVRIHYEAAANLHQPVAKKVLQSLFGLVG